MPAADRRRQPPNTRPVRQDGLRLTPAALAFVGERLLASFTTLRADGTPHVTPVGFTWDDEHTLARVITGASSAKVRNVGRNAAVVLCQFEGRRWLALEGIARVNSSADAVADAVQRYAVRYRPPRSNPTRVAIEVAVTRIYGSAALLD